MQDAATTTTSRLSFLSSHTVCLSLGKAAAISVGGGRDLGGVWCRQSKWAVGARGQVSWRSTLCRRSAKTREPLKVGEPVVESSVTECKLLLSVPEIVVVEWYEG